MSIRTVVTLEGAAILLAFALVGSGTANAQPTPVAAVPAPPVTTVWHRLGIPQAFTRVRDNTLNRRGNFPGLEKKPPVLRLADAANLESPNDAIRAAAEVKKEEDLAKQKVKALKYLATIGCGCYDKDKKIEKAILAGLEDCTPSVRMAAIDAIVYVVESCDPQSSYGYRPSEMDKLKKCIDDHTKCDELSDKCRMMGVGKKCKAIAEHIAPSGGLCKCQKCQRGRSSACSGCCSHCCSEKIHKRLAAMAFEEKNGCYIEPLADIREAARKAMCLCPAPICDEEEEEAEEPIEAEEAEEELEDVAEGSDDADDADEEAEIEAEPIPAPAADEATSNDHLRFNGPENASQTASTQGSRSAVSAGLAVRRRSVSRPAAVMPVRSFGKAELGNNYQAVVEVAGAKETLLMLGDKVEFTNGQRVLCVLDGEPNVVVTVAESRTGSLAVAFDREADKRRLRPGSSVHVRALNTPARSLHVTQEVTLAKVPTQAKPRRRFAAVVEPAANEEDLGVLAHPSVAGGWQPRVLR